MSWDTIVRDCLQQWSLDNYMANYVRTESLQREIQFPTKLPIHVLGWIEVSKIRGIWGNLS